MIKANKKLGQNFLQDQNLVREILDFVGEIREDNILEIGPGKCILTNEILNRSPNRLLSIEKDERFVSILENIKKENNNFEFIIGDATKINVSTLGIHNFKIIANLPYNISVILLLKWIYLSNFIDAMVLMFQKEVAQRIIATDGKKFGKLSVMVQLFCDVEYGFDIPASSFYPIPKVESTVIKIKPRKRVLYEVNYTLLEKVLDVTFVQRRKMLRKSLASLFGNNLQKLSSCIDLSKRPEDLSVEEFCIIANFLK